jgi:hypothetical protein
MTNRFAATALVLVLAGVAACGDSDGGGDAATGTSAGVASAVIDPGDGGDYRPEIGPDDFVDGIDNPYLPLRPGGRWVYETIGGEETERIEVEVLDERQEVFGVSAVAVRDRAFVDGELAEDTVDWFAQDRDGNVWYLGEETAEYEDGEVVTTAGSWAAGVDGALPGIVMLADPQPGAAYRQEFLAGEAEDLGEVLEVGGSATVPAGAFDDVLTTVDWTPLEPEVVEHKFYAPGVGLIAEEKVAGEEGRLELIEFTPGP